MVGLVGELVNNDANLAALAAGAHGEADPNGDYVVLLSGERFGAGIVAGGRLLLGRDGGRAICTSSDCSAGWEISTVWRPRLVNCGPRLPVPRRWLCSRPPGPVPGATAVVRTLADRLAQVVAALASLLNPERVIVAGAVATSLGQVIDLCRQRLPEYAQLPPELIAIYV